MRSLNFRVPEQSPGLLYVGSALANQVADEAGVGQVRVLANPDRVSIDNFKNVEVVLVDHLLVVGRGLDFRGIPGVAPVQNFLQDTDYLSM